MEAILEFLNTLFEIIVGIFGWAFYISCIPGVALLYIAPTIFLIVSSKLRKEQPDKYEKLFKIALIIFIICIILFIGLMIWSMLDFSNSYSGM